MAESVLSQERERYLVSKRWDWFLLGGGSLIFFALAAFLIGPRKVDYRVEFVYAVFFSSLLSYPHFVSSYLQFYRSPNVKLFRNPKHLFVGILAPLLVIVLLVAAYRLDFTALLDRVIDLYFLLIGWHYVRQVFFSMMAANSLQGFILPKEDKDLLLGQLLLLWLLSYIELVQIGPLPFRGYTYRPIPLQYDVHMIAAGAVVTMGLCVIYRIVRLFIQTGRLPAFSSIAAYVSVHFWLVFSLHMPIMSLAIPVFHALQYATLVYSMRRHEFHRRLDLNTRPDRKTLVKDTFGYAFVTAVLGFMLFWGVSWVLDQQTPTQVTPFGPTPWKVAIFAFFGLHHILLEAINWRESSPPLSTFLEEHRHEVHS